MEKSSSQPSVKFSKDVFSKSFEDDLELLQLMNVQATDDELEVKQTTETLVTQNSQPEEEPLKKYQNQTKETLATKTLQPEEPLRKLSLHELAKDSWEQEWENSLFDTLSFSDAESETLLPVVTSDQPVIKKITSDEFRDNFNKIIELPTLSQLSLTTPDTQSQLSSQANSEKLIRHIKYTSVTNASEEQTEEEETSYTSTSTGSEDTLHVSEDDELLEKIQELDERNYQLIQEMESAIKPTEEEENLYEFINIAADTEGADLPYAKTKREEPLTKLQYLVSDFLNNLIDHVIRAANLDDPLVILRKRLDKNKLLNKLVELVIASHREQHINKILNRKTADYFRRKQAFKNICQNCKIGSAVEIEKCKTNMDNLDVLLGYQKSMLENKFKNERNLQAKINTLTEAVNNEIASFEELVRSSFTRPESSERHIAAINTLLNKLAKARNEITEFRRDLIFRQSQIAHLKKDLKALEYIAPGLHLADYNNQLTETIGLSKMVEDKEYQIQVHRKRCHEALHTVNHILENIQMAKSMLEIKKDDLDEIEEEKQDLREALYLLKLEHLFLLQENKQMHNQAGILGKSAIMLDYDKISESVPQVKKRIEKLKEVHKSLSIKVFNLAELCDKS